MSAHSTATKIIAEIPDIEQRKKLRDALCPTASWFRKVQAFHSLYGLPDFTGKDVDLTASHMSDERLQMRLGLVTEEADELAEAVANRDVVEITDALADLIYVVAGFALELGVNLNSAISEVHASNMTKLDSDGSVIRREDGKILKGNSYLQPDIKAALGL
jgi:NTP pyrophosphatase (non-canonical NTP hydrolase)